MHQNYWPKYVTTEYVPTKTGQYQDPTSCEKYLRNIIYTVHSCSKICSSVFHWTLSVQRSEQFSKSKAQGKLFASHNWSFLQTNMWAYFHTKFILFLQDSATLLAEIVTSCTKATVPASEVWEKLLHRGDKMITGNNCT